MTSLPVIGPITDPVLLGYADVALREGRLGWRVTDAQGRPCNGGRADPVPLGEWSPTVEDAAVCQRGWHTTTDPLRWRGVRVWLVEGQGPAGSADDEACWHRIRPLAEVDPAQAICWRVLVAASRADLHGADLRGAYLHGADLSGADLRRADLRGADLRGADLRRADLRAADLRRADLHGAELRGAYLHGAYLHGAYLRGADLHGADLSGADLRRADLRGADLSEAYLREADLSGADLGGWERGPDGFARRAP